MGKRRYRAMTYVYPRKGSYQFRYPIPEDVRSYFPKGDGSRFHSHFVGSLHTGDRDEANRRALVKFAEFERRFSMLRDGIDSPHFAPFFRSLFDFELEQGRRRRATSIRSVESLDAELRTLRHALEYPEPGELKAVAGWVVDHYFSSATENVAAQVPDDTALSDALLEAAAGVLLDVYTQLSAEAKGMPVAPKPKSAVLVTTAQDTPKAGENLALSPEGRLSLAAYFAVHEKAKQKSSSPVAAHTMKRRKTAWQELSEFLSPTTPLFKVTKSEINRFRDELLEAPARAGSIAALRPLSFPERVQAMRANPSKYNKLDLNSVGDRLRQINAVFVFAVDRGDLDRNPAQGVSEGKKASDKARDYYKDTELQLIFSTPPFDRPPPVDQQTDEYWVPLLELFLGARASELYLRTNDVVLDHDIPHLRLVEHDQRTLKNASSARALPIHPQLIELGFLDFCRLAMTRGGELFPTWRFRKDQKPSEGPGRRRFNKHLRKLLPDRGGFRADSHTFRHNFESALASAFAPADASLSHGELLELNRVVARLSGRAFRGSASTYTHDLAILPEMAEIIAKVRYRGLSLKHLVPN
jgi:hypothetical protein